MVAQLVVFVAWSLITLGALLPTAALVLLAVMAWDGEAAWWCPLAHVLVGALAATGGLAGAGDTLYEQAVVTFVHLVLSGLLASMAMRSFAATGEFSFGLVYVFLVFGVALTPTILFLPSQLWSRNAPQPGAQTHRLS